jgi:hypothetical protein
VLTDFDLDDSSPTTIVIDMDGTVVHELSYGGSPARLLPDGTFMVAGGRDGLEVTTLFQLSWDGAVLWSFSDWDDGSARQHHDYQVGGTNPVGYYAPDQTIIGPADGGNVVMLTHENLPIGVQDIAGSRLRSDVIIEVEPGGEVVWQWHAAEHFDEMGFSEAAAAAIYERGGDWLHVNSLSYLGANRHHEELQDERFAPDNLIVGSRNGNFYAIIDKQSGSIVWRIGPDFSAGTPEHHLGPIIGAHHIHIVPQGLPGAGNILLFDNGSEAGYGDQLYLRDYSRVLELDPVDLSLVWEYAEDLNAERVSSAQRLPNGNTLICEGTEGRVIEVTPDKDIVWELQVTEAGFDSALTRAYRVPYSGNPSYTD